MEFANTSNFRKQVKCASYYFKSHSLFPISLFLKFTINLVYILEYKYGAIEKIVFRKQ